MINYYISYLLTSLHRGYINNLNIIICRPWLLLELVSHLPVIVPGLGAAAHPHCCGDRATAAPRPPPRPALPARPQQQQRGHVCRSITTTGKVAESADLEEIALLEKALALAKIRQQMAKVAGPAAPASGEYSGAAFTIKTFNAISSVGLTRFPKGKYAIAGEVAQLPAPPMAIMLRSHNLKVVGGRRAGSPPFFHNHPFLLSPPTHAPPEGGPPSPPWHVEQCATRICQPPSTPSYMASSVLIAAPTRLYPPATHHTSCVRPLEPIRHAPP